MTNETYVTQDGIEVRKTGRKAKKAGLNKTIEMVEITPANEYDGSWKKWVLPVTLFEIQPED